jgi:hypothetical protein
MIAKLREYFLPLSDDVTMIPPDEDDVDYKGDVAMAIQADVDFYLEHEHEIMCIDNIDELIIPYIPRESSKERLSTESKSERDSFGGKSRKKKNKTRTRKLKKKYTKRINCEYFV